MLIAHVVMGNFIHTKYEQLLELHTLFQLLFKSSQPLVNEGLAKKRVCVSSVVVIIFLPSMKFILRDSVCKQDFTRTFGECIKNETKSKRTHFNWLEFDARTDSMYLNGKCNVLCSVIV